MAKITFLGSAAAEGIPAIFCGCEICRRARANGGKDLRLQTSYALNDHVRIDFGQDSRAAEQKAGISSADLRHVLFTHGHHDHVTNIPFGFRRAGFSHEYFTPLTVHARPSVINMFLQAFYLQGEPLQTLKFEVLRLFAPLELPEEDMTIVPLPANHGQIPDESVFFAIRHGKSWMLLVHDCGIPPEPAWEWLRENPRVYDLVITDGTMGLQDCRCNHLGGRGALEVHQRLADLRLIDTHTQYYVNHFSHNGKATHADLEAFFNPHGIQVGYDGLVLEY